jgi:hypothetical protein
MPMFQGSLPTKTPAMELTDLDLSRGSSFSNFDDVERQTPDTIPFAKSPKFSNTKGNLFDRDLPLRYALDDYFLSEIDTAWSDLPLIGCGYVSGLIDALSYNAWGNFSNMHTGRDQSMLFIRTEL